MLNKKIASIALFMMALIILIPVYSANAIATSFSVYTISGKDGVNGYRRYDDQTLITAQAELDGDSDITPNQVRFGTDSFSTCVNIGGGIFQCSYSSLQFAITPKSYTVSLYLWNDTNVSLSTASSEITVDNTAPAVSSFDTTQTSVGAEDINFSYTVDDTACTDATCSGKCSGINNIDVYGNNAFLQKISLNSSSCSVSGAFGVNSSQLTATSSDVSVCITAYDKFNFSSSASCKTLSVDLSAPTIDTASFAIKSNDVSIFYIPAAGISATVSVDVSDDSGIVPAVSADLSKINPIYAVSVPADSCTGPGPFTCYWNSRIVTANSTQIINITATDSAGNSKTEQITYNFGIDNTAPDVTFIGTDNIFNGTSYIVSGYNTLKVTITEAESGIDAVYLDLSEIGGGASVAANNCTASGSTWDCYWYNVTSTLANNIDGKIWIYGDLKDRSGNTYTGLTYGTVKADLLTPSVDSIIMSSFDALGSHNYTKSGDLLTLVVNLTEDKDLNAMANFSGIGLGENEPGACVDLGSSKWSCLWETTGIASGPLSTYLKFNFSDPFGNSLLYSYPIVILAVGNETSPDYWELGTITAMPYALELGVMNLIEQRMYFSIPLSSLNPDAGILSMELGSCTGDVAYLSEDPSLINAEQSLNPYILLQFAATADNLTELVYNCSLNIMSQVGNTIMDYPEVENLSLAVSFYKGDLGGFGDNVEDKIEKEKDNWLVDSKWISTLKKFLYYAEKICGLLNTLGKLKALWTQITQWTTVIAKFQPIAVQPVLMTTQTSNEVTTTGLKKATDYLDGFCKFVSCSLYVDPNGKFGIIGKIQTGGTSLIDKMGGDLVWSWTGKTPFNFDYTGRDPSGYMNPKDSIVLSMLTFCIPGIIYNLEKYRQIKCQYIDCLQNEVPQGIPISACDAVQSQETCKYFVGEIFKVFPFTAMFDYYMGMIKDMLSDPLKILGTLVAWYCKPLIGQHEPYLICTITDTLSLIGDIIQDVKAMGKGWKLEGEDYCKKI
ncbi:MAG: hypothetical protein Q7J54_05125 [Candidatus Woesearchaeota archaeon]|nr:hypothetical protein [Candidatus Woesearchaeota archaeon]